MTTTAQSLIKEAQELLQDVDGVRWPATELVAHLNDGQREIATLRPEMFVYTTDVQLVPGARQTVPSDCSKFIEVPRNTNGIAVLQTNKNILDALDPSWSTKTGSLVIKHFCYDPRDNNVFWVYPPASAGASVDIMYSRMPSDIGAPSGAAYTTVTGTLRVADFFKNALLHFVLFRAWAKDAEFGGNANLSATHYQLFKSGLSDDMATTASVKPTVNN